MRFFSCNKIYLNLKKLYLLNNMDRENISIYDLNLKIYTLIIAKKIQDKDIIIRCLRVFEYLEIYEKCEDLMKILEDIK